MDVSKSTMHHSLAGCDRMIWYTALKPISFSMATNQMSFYSLAITPSQAMRPAKQKPEKITYMHTN